MADQALNGTVVIEVSGDLDLASAPALRQRLVDAVALEPVSVILDLTNLAFIDSSGLGVLIAGLKRANQSGVRLVLQSVPAQAESVIAMAGLKSLFDRTEE